MSAARAHLTLVPTAPSSDGDDTLVAGARAGDPMVANALVRRAGPRAKAAIRRLLRRPSADDADLLQLVLIELVTTLDAFRGECSLNTWIDRIASHVVYKRLRKQKLEQRFFEGLGEDAERVAGSASAERAPLTANVLERVKHLLSDVDPEKVSTWLMFDVHGLTLEEVAHALEITPVAAQSRVSRARREVRACLDREPELVEILSTLEAP